LQEVSFSIAKGQISGIIGPNGSGKSTLFKGITGELPVPPGAIFLENEDVGRFSGRKQAQSIAIVSQFAEAIDITVEEYVLMGRIPYRRKFLQAYESAEDFEIARKYMKLTHVHHLRHKKFTQLSGGEQQLVNIAKALSQEPRLLLMDEPTSHLDISHQSQVLNLVQQLSEDLGLTVLLIIHDLNLASEYCDYLVLMKAGKVHTQGEPKEVLNYRNIEEVYQTVVVTQENPLSKKPAVFIVSNKLLKDHQKLE
jgi:iron complex transport system ATP-binding protein